MNFNRLIMIILLVLMLMIAYSCSDKEECPAQQCPTCPAQKECPTVECPACKECPAQQCPEKNITKITCDDGSVVDNASKCPSIILTPSELIPVTTNEAGTHIESSSLRAACRNGLNAGEIYFKTGLLPDSYEIQVRDRGSGYSSRFSGTGVFSKYIYFTVCNDCHNRDDFTLNSGSVYLVRAALKYGSKTEYTNEYLADIRKGSEFMSKKCS